MQQKVNFEISHSVYDHYEYETMWRGGGVYVFEKVGYPSLTINIVQCFK